MPKKHEVCVSPYPFGKSFAFTIIDDTDRSTLETCKPVYDCLISTGLRITKTVWVKEAQVRNNVDDYGDTTERSDYLAYIKELQELGFEIALHNVSSDDNMREDIIMGVEKFKEHFGEYPSINVMHDENKENLYFDAFLEYGYISRPFFTKYLSALYEWYIYRKKMHDRWAGVKRFFGEDKNSPYFWGDICKEKFRYVRSYVNYPDLNTLKCNPNIPYHEQDKPYVNHWFDGSNGEDCEHFNRLLSVENIKRLVEDGGCAIVYTHFGRGFVTRDNEGQYCLNNETKRILQAISRLDGWFVPVSVLLDRLKVTRNIKVYGGEGILVANLNDSPVDGVTLCTQSGQRYWTHSDKEYVADERGNLVIDRLLPNECIFLESSSVRNVQKNKTLYWRDQNLSQAFLDARTITEKLLKVIGRK